MPVAGTESPKAPQGGRLLVASQLATALSRAGSVESVAAEAVRALHDSFAYYLAVVQRLDPDGVLRVVALEGPSAAEVETLLAHGRRVEIGVNGRVARTGRPAMVNDTGLDPDYLGRADGKDPGSQLSLPIVVAETNWGVLNLEQRERGAFGEEDLLLAHVVAGQIGAAIHRCLLVGELEDAFLTTIGVISDAVEMQDSYTANHAEEVSDLAVRVGERMGIDGVELDRLRYGALLHDVGKISIPAEIIHLRRLPRDDLGPQLPQGDERRGRESGAAGLLGHAVSTRGRRGAPRRAGPALDLLIAAEVAEHRLFGHPDQPEPAVGAHVAGANADVGAVRADHLDDGADVADLAVVAVIGLDRFHLLRHDFADLALVEHQRLL